jgi:hypothetical protein
MVMRTGYLTSVLNRQLPAADQLGNQHQTLLQPQRGMCY